MNSRQQMHPSQEVLEQYSIGHLSEMELERVENHLFVCEQCQDELTLVDAHIRDMKQACREVQRQPVPERVSFWNRLFSIPRPVYAGAFAALALAVVLPVAQYRPTPVSPASVELTTSRGDAQSNVTEAEARRPMHLKLGVSDLASAARGEIVDHNGSKVWTGSPITEAGSSVLVVNDRLSAGQYWVRVYDSQNELVREFGLQLK